MAPELEFLNLHVEPCMTAHLPARAKLNLSLTLTL